MKISVIDRAVNNSLPAPTLAASANPMQIWIGIGQIIWLIGLIVLIIYSVITTIRLSKKLESAILITDNIYETKTFKTPFVFGLIKPKVYLPMDLSESEKTYIIRHEQTHIKRYDHIIKFIAFIVVSIHWFNPLVWIAFFLMGKDMELSCDERVINELGNGIKKDYSNSLLSLSTGRRIIGGSPLAFGENNTKGRIKNILNYKKPRFWITLVGIIVVVVASVGLLSNPKDSIINKPVITELKSVEDYAREFVNDQIAMYEDPNGAWQGFKIIDSKITKLEKLVTFDNILESPIEIWSLEFRLKPDDISKVAMAGGMQEEDGWITDDSSMGKPFLAFTNESNNINLLGSFYPQEFGFDTLAKQEIGLRIMLENNGLLPNESHKEATNDELRTGIGESTKFTEEEIDDAIKIVKDNFAVSSLNLTRIWYNEEESDKIAKIYLENGKGSINGAKAENVLVLLTNFDVDDSDDNPTLNPGSTYEDFLWILIREDKIGKWKIDDSGY